MGARQTCHTACNNCATDCARTDKGYGDDVDEDRPGGDPAGTTFEETLEDLSMLDRQLMLFCATSNLAAVRWLLFLGAHWDTCDANNTTCLHVACRSGGLPIVKELMTHRELVQTVDVAGWCALHIAVLMGRREVVVRLLQAGAQPGVRTSKGQLPRELCADSATSEVLRSYEEHAVSFPDKEWDLELAGSPGEDENFGSRLQYEPFFVPRQPVVQSSFTHKYKKDLQRIGMLVFNQMPGYGLGFLVATGVTRDYPVDLSAFLRRARVDIKQVGSFLGEAFSLSHTIRLEFINSSNLKHTGIVSALVHVCRMMRMPDDLQKINRLVHGVARIWWRQHEKLAKTDEAQSALAPVVSTTGAPEELVGLELKQYITSFDALHQLMFSTVMLHWYVYKDGADTQRDLPYRTWKQMNSGIEAGGGDVTEHVQMKVHSLICKAFIPELAVAGRSDPSRRIAGGAADAGGADGRSSSSSWAPPEALEGWTQVVGGSFPKPPGGGVQSVSYQQMSNMFSEVTTSSAVGFGGSVIGRAGDVPPLALGSLGGTKSGDFTWLSLCHMLLFFSANPTTGVPYAFVELSKVRVWAVEHGTRTLTLVGAASEVEQGGGSTAACDEGNSPVCVVLLLPDGRWQELSLKRLEFRFAGSTELLAWSNQLTGAVRGQTEVQANPKAEVAEANGDASGGTELQRDCV